MDIKTFKKVVLGLGVVALFYFVLMPDEKVDRLHYQTQEITSGSIESIVNAAGTISPVVTVEVGSELSGVISELMADFNSIVKKGQLIARLDSRTIRASVQQAEADLAMAKASLAQQKAGLTKSLAQLRLSNQQYKRQSQLLSRGLASEAEVDDRLARLEMAEADAELSRAQIHSSRAQILQRQAHLEQAKLNLERTEIRSPVSGIVINRQVDIGQTVAASLSAPLLFEIAQNLSSMQIEADVDEADIGKLLEGQRVRFQVDAYPSRKFQGQISQIRKASNTVANVVTYKVIISATNEDQSLLPGMTANVDIILGEKERVLRAPNTALRFRPAGTENSVRKGAHPLKAAFMSLDLEGQQKEKAGLVLKKSMDEMKSFRENNLGNWRSDLQLQQIRQKLFNELKLLLTQDQVEKFEILAKGHFLRGTKDGATYLDGELWVLENDSPTRVAVLTGLSNDEYTELISDQLNEGDPVIVRVTRGQKN